MRKAVAATRRNNRRKQEGAQNQPQQQQNQYHTNPHHGPDSTPERRKLSQEEAALTAKNYRLAKELSELRVRHREECKNVTRLTMENMNLASRCREAISHVAMLKKELSVHQKRSAEALAFFQQQQRSSQQQQQQKGSPQPQGPRQPLQQQRLDQSQHEKAPESPRVGPAADSPKSRSGPSVTDVVAELERMDRILASPQVLKAIPAPGLEVTSSPSTEISQGALLKTPSPVAVRVSVGSTSPNNKSFSTPQPDILGLVSSDDYEESIEVPESEATRILGSGTPSRPALPHVTPVRRPQPVEGTSMSDLQNDPPSEKNAKDDWTADEAGDKLGRSNKFFPHSASPKLGRGGYNEEFPGDITMVRKSVRKSMEALGNFKESDEEVSVQSGSSSSKATPFDKIARDRSTLSSIDAFEASFTTNFPDSFSPKDDAEEKKSSDEIYNPFSPSPQRSVPLGSPASDSSWKQGNRELQVTSSGGRNGMRRPKLSDPPGTDRTSQRPLKPTIPASNRDTQNKPPHASRPVKGLPASNMDGTANLPPTDGITSRVRPPSNVSSSRTLAVTKSPSASDPAFVKNSPSRSPRSRSNDDSIGSAPATLVNGHNSASPSRPIAVYSPHQSGVPSENGDVRNQPRTPPPLGTLPLSGGQPRRPEKAGYDAARARYEKALQPRDYKGAATKAPGTDHPSDEKLPKQGMMGDATSPDRSRRQGPILSDAASPDRMSVRDRAAAFAEAASPKSRTESLGRRSWQRSKSDSNPLSDEESEGDIPMHTSLNKSGDELVINGVTLMAPPFLPSSDVMALGSSRRSRSRPWDPQSPSISTS